MKGLIKLFGKGRKPLRPETKMQTIQLNLKDFNNINNNNSARNVMTYLDVQNIKFERGGFNDEEE